MLGQTKGNQLTKYVPDYVLFDLETTGISAEWDEIIEIAAVKVRGGKIAEEFSELVNPGKPIPLMASQVNHITDKMVAGADSIAKILPRFLEFIGEDVLVGHNIHSFDMKFIYRDCDRLFHKTISNSYVDTLALAKKAFPGWKHRRLGDLAEYYHIPTQGAHRALQDCRMNQQVMEHLGKELAKLGGTAQQRICPKCGRDMVKRSGMYGEFFGCSGFPACRQTQKV